MENTELVGILNKELSIVKDRIKSIESARKKINKELMDSRNELRRKESAKSLFLGEKKKKIAKEETDAI
jgi:hypothetical protein